MHHNNRNLNSHGVEYTSPRGVVPQKKMETLRVLSNIRVPNTNNSHSGYMTEKQLPTNQNNIQHSEVDIIDTAFSSAINEHNQQHMMEELTNMSVSESLLEALSPWEVEDIPSDPKWASSSTTKKDKSGTKKTKRSTMKEVPLKKQKSKDVPNQLKTLLLQCDSKKEKSTCVEEPVIILSNSNPEEQENVQIFSQDTDMAVFKQAIELKRALISDKNMAEKNFNTCENNVSRLRNELTLAEKELEEVRKLRDNLIKKLEWVLQSL